MKNPLIWITAFVVLLAAYFGGTWMTSQMAHAQVERFTDHVTRESHGLLKVTDKKSIPGFFTSTEDITFTLDYPLATKLLGDKALQFTIHNVIQHGPLPGFRAIGIARTESSLVMDEATRKSIKDVLGTDRPIELAITFGFFGETAVDITSPAMNVRFPDNPGVFEWKGLKSHTVVSRTFDEVRTATTMPGLSAKSKDGSSVVLDNLELKGQFKTAFESLYTGEGKLTMESFDITPSNTTQGSIKLKKVGYIFTTTADDQFYNMSIKVGAANMESAPLFIKDLHFDFSMNHLHGPTLASMYSYLQSESTRDAFAASASEPAVESGENSANALESDALLQSVDSPASAPAPKSPFDFARIQADAGTLMKHSPEVVFDHLGFSTNDGTLKITARIKFVGITDQDVQSMDTNQLLKKLNATADIAVAQGLIDHWPVPSQEGMKQQLLEMERQGFLKRKGDQLESHIEYADGKLVANGKTL